MISARWWLVVRIGMIAGLIGLVVLFCNFAAGGQVQAAPGFQDTPGYDGFATDLPEPTDSGSGYPGFDSTETSAPPSNPPSNTLPAENTPTVSAVTPSPAITATQTQTPTNAPNIFQTEDSEIGNSQATLAVTDTPGSTATAYRTPTATRTPRQITPTATVARKKSGLGLNWGMFWIGFSLPVLGACGLVLYLLDRRPDLFKRRR